MNSDSANISGHVFLQTADGSKLVRIVDVIRHVMARDGLPAKLAARHVHDTMRSESTLPFFTATESDFPRPLDRRWLFTWIPGTQGSVSAGFDAWCRLGEPNGFKWDYLLGFGVFAMTETDASRLFGFGNNACPLQPIDARTVIHGNGWSSERRQECLKRFRELGGKRPIESGGGGTRGALATLARETDVDKDTLGTQLDKAIAEAHDSAKSAWHRGLTAK